MHIFAHRTIVFRLWLALSAVGAICTTLAFGSYVWLSIGDDLAHAQQQTTAKIEVARSFGHLHEGGRPAGHGETPVDLGLQIEIFDDVGLVSERLSFGPELIREPVNRALLQDALEGTATRRMIRLNDGNFTPEAINHRDVLLGGRYGEERVVPLEAGGALRVIADYSEVTASSRTLIYRSIIAADLIIIGLLFGTWLLLRHFVATPLRQYSRLAMEMAVGQPTRMPTSGSENELDQLARAVNGMADALEYQATVDALTGLYNLRHLSSHLEALLADAAQTRESLSVIFGDLDNLKPVNDTYGHEAGDRVLRAVGEAILGWAGTSFFCWRLGGDEFVVALPRCGEDQAPAMAAELQKVVSSLLVPVADTNIRPSLSIGIATFPPDGSSAGTLLGIADRRMYAAKAARSVERRLAGTSAA
jgi:diguanylate cyclase (GGDEF)-like protein